MKIIHTTSFRVLALGTALALPGLVAAQYPSSPPPAPPTAAPAPAKTSEHPRLSRFLAKIRKNRTLANAEVKARKVTAEEARQFRTDLDKLEKKARALAMTTKDLMDDSEKSLEAELNQIVAKFRAGKTGS